MNIRLTPEQERLLTVMHTGLDVAMGEPSDFQALAAKGLASPVASSVDDVHYYMITDQGVAYLREFPIEAIEARRCDRCMRYAAECTPTKPRCLSCQDELRYEERNHRAKYDL